MKSADAAYVAVGAAQLLMGKTASIEPDGKWGTYTQSVYDKSTPEVKASVVGLLKSIGNTSPAELYSNRILTKAKAQVQQVDRSDITGLIRKIAAEQGVPADTALRIAFLESRFDPRALSPTGAKGVMQLTSIAIKDIKQRGGFEVTDPYDPVQNITGGIIYMKLVARDVKARLDEPSKIYMGFNIGPTGARAVVNGKAHSVAKLINQQAYGGPDVYAENLDKAVRRVVI